MKITLHGATREVTGSCYLIESKKIKILVDCGMFQGSNFAQSKNFAEFGFNPKEISAVVITHAHLDHTGRLPLLFKRGFKGVVYLTPPTKELTKLILEDAEGIMEENFRTMYTPKLYDQKDVALAVKNMKSIDDRSALCLKDLQIRFHNAGHILGSAFIQITEASTNSTVTFSGDLGNISTPILQPKDKLNQTNVLFIESTYGNRLHENKEKRNKTLKQTIISTIKKRGVLLIPSFAIERTQELLYDINDLVNNKLIPFVDIYMDSPMAASATDIFNKYPRYYNKKSLQAIALGDKLFDFPGLKVTRSRDESKEINHAKKPKIIIAGSGMMSGGRILHHLIRYLGDKKNTLLIIGYQSRGTLGRRLYNGETGVRIFDEYVQVKANIVSIGGFSAHADQQMLLDWINSADVLPDRIYCTHGEEEASAALATRIHEKFQIKAHVPRYSDEINL